MVVWSSLGLRCRGLRHTLVGEQSTLIIPEWFAAMSKMVRVERPGRLEDAIVVSAIAISAFL